MTLSRKAVKVVKFVMFSGHGCGGTYQVLSGSPVLLARGRNVEPKIPREKGEEYRLQVARREAAARAAEVVSGVQGLLRDGSGEIEAGRQSEAVPLE
ncbi:hypothetical protein BASA81_012419 [Batrachochytrium salamandrivorans]|nr:hypothetical protein BASA81_012419 [Batrachochytrium salamandrivorans]